MNIEKHMEIANFILTFISAIAAVVSSVTSVSARNVVKSLRDQIAGTRIFKRLVR